MQPNPISDAAVEIRKPVPPGVGGTPSGTFRDGYRRFRNLNRIVLFGSGMTLAGISLHGADEAGLEKYKALIQRNPFLPKSDASKMLNKSSAATPYRFTGLITVGGKTLVGIENPSENKSYLLEKGKNMDGLEVKECNAKEKNILLVVNGEPMQLSLAEAPVGPSVIPPSPMGTPPMSMGPDGSVMGPAPSVTSTGVVQQIRRRIIVPTRK